MSASDSLKAAIESRIVSHPELWIGVREPYIVSVPHVEAAPGAPEDPMLAALAENIQSVKIPGQTTVEAGQHTYTIEQYYRRFLPDSGNSFTPFERSQASFALFAGVMDKCIQCIGQRDGGNVHVVADMLDSNRMYGQQLPVLLLAMDYHGGLKGERAPQIDQMLQMLRQVQSEQGDAVEALSQAHQLLQEAGDQAVYRILDISDEEQAAYRAIAGLYETRDISLKAYRRNWNTIDHWLLGRAVEGTAQPNPITTIQAGVRAHAQYMRESFVQYDGVLPITFDPAALTRMAHDNLVSMVEQPSFYAPIVLSDNTTFHVGIGPNIVGMVKHLGMGAFIGNFIYRDTIGMSTLYKGDIWAERAEHRILLSTGAFTQDQGMWTFDRFRFAATLLEEMFHKAEELTLMEDADGEKKPGRKILDPQIVARDREELSSKPWQMVLETLQETERRYIESGLEQFITDSGLVPPGKLQTMTFQEKMSRCVTYVVELSEDYRAKPQENQNAEHLGKLHVLNTLVFRSEEHGMNRTDILAELVPGLYDFYSKKQIPAMDAFAQECTLHAEKTDTAPRRKGLDALKARILKRWVGEPGQSASRH